jgi:hypothetical protein
MRSSQASATCWTESGSRTGAGAHDARPLADVGPCDYAASVKITSGEGMGWLRAAVGVGLLAAPAVPMRLSGREAPTSAAVLLMRTVGIRDLVLGLGTAAAARSGAVADGRRWTAAALASDSLDVAVSAASFRSIGRRDAAGAAVLALTFVCGDLWALASARGPASGRLR